MNAHPGELRAARAWASRNEYTFSWQDDRSDALDCKCVIWDANGRHLGEWIGGTAGAMTKEEKLEVESMMALDQMYESDAIPREPNQ